ncbi:MAG: hypothetical protein JNK09_03080 [Prolixibacteraceae bacterium]|nr:hypothetical protein [Prolixibacteraceae bacterium]
MKKRITTILLVISTISSVFAAGWEIISPGVDIRNVVVVDDAWFGIKRIQNGTIVQMLLAHSENKGFSWQTIDYFKEVYTISGFKNKLIVYADRTNERGFYLSTNNGSTWKKLPGPFNVGASQSYITDKAIFITIQQNPGVASPIYRSLDGGETFQPLSIDVGSISYNFARRIGNMTSFDGKLFVYVGRVGIFSSGDNGNTWKKENNGIPAFAVNSTSSNVAGVLSQAGNNLYFYVSDNDFSKTYIYKNGTWTEHNPDRFYYEPSYYKDYVKGGTINPSPTAYRAPFLFSNDAAEYTSGLHYSVDEGKSWYSFMDQTVSSVHWNSIIIDGNYVYCGSILNGFARRRLSEAKNYAIKKPRAELNLKLPTSPEELKNLLSLTVAEGLEELFSTIANDYDGLLSGEVLAFLNDYLSESTGSSSGLLGNSQPGSCSLMGMPTWSVNIANLKLFMRDVLFRKKGKGVEVQLALNYLNKADENNGMFGKRWRFEFESGLTKRTTSVILRTGTGAKFIFSNNTPIQGGATSYKLPCLNNSNLELQWSGTSWILSKNRGAEKHYFTQKNDSVFILKEVVDSYNQKTTLTHNAQGLISSITDASNRKYTFYNNNGHCDSIASADGRIAKFTYSNNLLISSSDFEKVKTTYTYNANQDIITVNISGKQTKFEYNYQDDANGMLSAVIDPENRRIEYNSSFITDSSVLTTVNFPGEKMISYTTSGGLVTSISNSSGEKKSVYYNSKGDIDSLVYYDGSKVAFKYDEKDNMIRKKDRNNVEHSYQYDSSKNLIRYIKLPYDTVFTRTYNLKNQITSIEFQGKLATVFSYDSNGALTGIKSPGGNNHTFMRDGYGNITSYINPLNQTTRITYDANGLRPISRTDFSGNTYGMDYDGNGRLKKINLPGGKSRTINYDCCVQVGKTDENGNTISVTRDATNRILSYRHAEGWTSAPDYNSEGYISGFTNRYGMKTYLEYNERGIIKSVTDDDGKVLFEYNKAGNPVSVTDRKGNITQFSYDINGYLAGITDASGAKVNFEFSSSDKLKSFTNARGQKTQFTYNSQGLVKEKAVQSSILASYTYNKDGLMTSFSDITGITQYVRNAAGFVTKIIYPGNLEVNFTYDANGNLATTIYPNGLLVTNECDVLNQIKKVSWNSSSVEFTYNPAGYMLTETRSNGTKTIFDYNKDNIPVSIDHKVNNVSFSNELVSISSGIITAIKSKSPASITSAPQLFTGAEINILNQLISSFEGYNFSYDTDGNMIKATKNNTQQFAATYTADNKISSLQTDNQTIQLTYDGMRYPRKITSAGNVRNLFYDHRGRLLFETDATGNVVINYIYKGKRLIASQTNQNQVGFYHSSRLGHIVAITGSNGSLLKAYQYTANGEIIGETGTAENRFTFLGAFGGIKLSNSYILTGARVYHTITGRYIQRDPMGMLTGTNPYLYASDNPVTGIDPLGLDDLNVTVNTPKFDPPSDNNYGNAGGTANPYADGLPYRDNDWDTYGSAAAETAKELSDHPIMDLLPNGFGNPLSVFKALDKAANKEFGNALWQLVPFNNSLEAAGSYIKDAVENYKPDSNEGNGFTPIYTNQLSYPCNL